ncbi:MAG TPA: CPBP family intramembrane glutamic endopeptidase [Pyrinomonadaceae bacterium]|nr:CPBP family intramembrane glutamic endopeptidase [Pyrinomonadaceae bacterium]
MDIVQRDEAGRIIKNYDRTLAAWEIVSVISSVLIAEWVIFSVGGGSNLLIAVPVGLAFLFIVLSHRARGETPHDLGWRFDNFLHAARLLFPPMLVATILCVSFGWWSGNLNFLRWRGGQSIWGMPVLGIAWGLLQQSVLQGFINRRAQIIWGRGTISVLVVALIFGALHLPNPALTVATFVGGVVWAVVYQRAPNLPALGLSHGLMTWVLISSLPPSTLHGLRVGFKYFG